MNGGLKIPDTTLASSWLAIVQNDSLQRSITYPTLFYFFSNICVLKLVRSITIDTEYLASFKSHRLCARSQRCSTQHKRPSASRSYSNDFTISSGNNYGLPVIIGTRSRRAGLFFELRVCGCADACPRKRWCFGINIWTSQLN
jgi:hypothetical protein